MLSRILIIIFITCTCSLVSGEKKLLSQDNIVIYTDYELVEGHGNVFVIDAKDINPFEGIYISPKEISGYQSSELLLQHFLGFEYSFQSHGNKKEIHGKFQYSGNSIFIPESYSHHQEKDEPVNLYIQKFHYLKINNHEVLLRNDAFKMYQNTKKFYDYGVLIKCEDVNKFLEHKYNGQPFERPSIKVLYSDNVSTEWKDPFIYGTNPQ